LGEARDCRVLIVVETSGAGAEDALPATNPVFSRPPRCQSWCRTGANAAELRTVHQFAAAHRP